MYLYTVCYVQWKTPDDGQRNCPKHVEFRTRINLEISAFVGFIVKKFSCNLTRLFFHNCKILVVDSSQLVNINYYILDTF
jgi:hypothetical protein